MDLDGVAVARVDGGVLDEVPQDVVDLRGIDIGVGRVGVDVHDEADVPGLGHRRQVVHHVVDQHRHVGGQALERFLAGIEQRQAQEVGDQPFHAGHVPLDHFHEAVALGVVGVVRQGIGVAADGGERRAQFVRDIGDEITPDLVGASEVGDVVQHHDHALAGTRHRPEPRHEVACDVAMRGELDGQRPATVEDAPNRGRHLGLAQRLDVRAAQRIAVEAQHAAGGVVDELQVAVAVADEHAFDHAGQDGVHAGAVARQRDDAPFLLVDGDVERAGGDAEFVVAVVRTGAAQVAEGEAPAGFRDEPGAHPDPGADGRRGQHGDDRAQREREPDRDLRAGDAALDEHQPHESQGGAHDAEGRQQQGGSGVVSHGRLRPWARASPAPDPAACSRTASP